MLQLKDARKEFFDELPPRLQIKLVQTLFSKYVKYFNYFFEDEDYKYSADPVFTKEVIINLECKLFSNKTSIIEANSDVDYLYFILKGGVNIFDDSNNFLIHLGQGSYFGDF